FFLFGNGRNGKSTFINIIQDLLGDYGRQTNSDTFLKKRNDSGINNDVARLDGARYKVFAAIRFLRLCFFIFFLVVLIATSICTDGIISVCDRL
ncbi:hypothetical protein GH879_33875, partial [Bacillus thuringiensis]|nr:hypothetical protein [Bacillus thuringiensis]